VPKVVAGAPESLQHAPEIFLADLGDDCVQDARVEQGVRFPLGRGFPSVVVEQWWQ
jgi:hypothetical protein